MERMSDERLVKRVYKRQANDRTRLEVVEMKCLRGICGLTRLDIVRNIDIRTRCE